MKKKLISGFLSFAIIASSVLPAGAIVKPSVPTDGARVWADDVRVEANTDATVKVQFEVDSNSRYTKIAGARASVSIPVDKTSVSKNTPLQIAKGENVETVRMAPSLGTTGSGKFNLVGSDNVKSLSVNMTVPTVKQTFPISVTPDYVSAKEPTGTDSVSLTGDKVNTAFGSVIVQYPVTVRIDGQKPTGASVSVKLTEYDTGKKTYAPGGTETELDTNNKFWVDSDTINNTPVLKITPPEGYTAEVTVNDGTVTKSSGNVSLDAVAKDTTVKVKFVQGQDTTVTGGDKPYVKSDGMIVIPGPDKKLGTNDDVYVQPEGKNPTGTINPTTGEVTTNKDTTVKIPGKNPPEANKKTDVTVPNGTKISADGTITLPENAGGTLKRDSGDLEVPAGSKIDAYGVVTFRYTVKAVNSKDNTQAEADRYVMVKEGVQQTITANAIADKIIDGKASVDVDGGTKTNDPDAYVVTFKYKLVSDVAGNNKVVLTIKHMYRGYEMSAIKQQIVDKNQVFKAVPEKFAGYAVKTYTYNATVDQTVTEAGVDITVAGESTITFVYDRTDNSVVVPVDKIIANGNDVVVKPTDSNQKPTENNDKSVTVPAGGAIVTTPDVAVKVPEGTKVKEDGTIILPDTNTPIDPEHPENVDSDKYCYVKYMPNGATGGSVVSEIFKKGETATILPNTFTRLNYHPNNWNTAENGLAIKYEASQTTNVSLILFAQWTEAAFNDTLKITLYRDGAKTESKEHTLGNYAGVVFAGNLPKNVFTVAGWTFAGWNTKADGNGDFYADGANITRNKADGELELYAQWYKKNQDGSITVPGADLVPETDKDATAKSDTDADLTRDGKTGVITIPGKGSVTTPTNEIVLPNGGKLHPNGTVEINKADGSTITVKPDGVIDPADALTVTYKANGPANTKDVVAYVDNASTTVIANPFKYDGYVFSRWQVEDDASREYVAGKTIDNITQNLVLKAMWFKVGPNGEITVPGKDGELEPGEKEKDNVTVNPDPSNPDKKPAVDNTTGNVKVPDGAQGEVIRPVPGTDDKTESIIVPGGTVVKPDGTIVLPDGKEIAPDGVIDENNPQGWIIVTYKSNNSKNEEKKQLAQTSATILNNVFKAEAGKAFDSWNEKANGTGAEVKNTVTESKTIYAIWKNEGSGNIKYRAVVTFRSNTDPEKTSDQVFTSADSKTITGTLNTNVFTAPADWTLMGWSENQNGTKGSTWYGDGSEISLTDGSHKDLYAIWHQDNTTSGDGSVVLPGKDGKTDAPNITVKPGAAGNKPSVKADAGYVEAKDGNEIEQPNGKITVVTGPVNVYPDGTVVVPEGSKVTMPDGSEKDGPAVINPDGKPDNNTVIEPDENGNITLPGPDSKLGNEDDVVVKGQPDKTPSGEIKSSGEVDITKATTVVIPGRVADGGKSEVSVPVNTVVKPNGTIILPDDAGATITKPDQTSVDVPGGSEIDAYGNITYKYWVEYKNGNKDIRAKDFYMVKNGATRKVAAPSISGYVVDGATTAEITGGNQPYTITFNYKKASETKVEYATVIRYTDSVEGTKIQTVTSTSNPIVGTLAKNSFTRENWSFLGWNTKADGNGTFYPDQNKFVLYDNEELELFTIWYKQDGSNIVVPGVDAKTDTNDDVTIKPDTNNQDVLPEPDGKGNIKVPENGIVERPGRDPITLPEGGLVKPDGTIIKPDGSVIKPDSTDPIAPENPNETKRDEQGNIVLPGVDKVLGTDDDVKVAPKLDANGKDNSIIDKDNDGRVLLPDGGTVERPIDPQNPAKGTEKIEVPEGTIVLPDGTIIYPGNVIQKPDNTIVVPGKDNKPETNDDVVLKPDNNGNSAGTVDKNGDTTVKPGGGTVSIPGKNPPDTKTDIQVPEGTVIKPDGTIIKPDGTTIYPDGSNNGNNNNGGNSGNHGSSSSGSSTTTYTIKATAGNGGSISPKGNVSVVRSSDKLFSFTADAGYEVASVLVDGKDIGKVSSYNFTNVRAAHTIEVKFNKIGAVEPKPNTVADPKETGVAGKLETDKHDAYMKGYANGTFGPNANMTRAEAAQMFYNLLLNKQTVADAGFTDVAADRWYADAVNTLAFMGIINGVGNNQFAPSRTISRAEFAAIATRFAKANSNGSLAFTDVKRSDWFYNSVLTAVNYGWIGGYSNGTFKPNNNITRAEVVSIVNKMLARSADKTFINSNASSIKSFTDVSKSFWGFYEVTEATNGHDHVKNDGVESWQ